VEVLAEIGSDWRDIAVNGLYLATDLRIIGRDDNREKHTPKYIRERKKHAKRTGRTTVRDDNVGGRDR
jgi:hypothetical protein